MALNKLIPSGHEAEQLANLLADAHAIPAAAFSRSKHVVARVIDLTAIPAQRETMRIPDATMSLIEAAEHHLVGYRR